MQLLIVGTLGGHITTAGKLAFARGAKVAHVETVDGAMEALRNGEGADLAMIDCVLDIKDFITKLKAERIHLPVVACGLSSDADSAVRAIKAGAKEYIPLPPDPDLIAAVLQAVAQETNSFIYRDPKMAAVLTMAEKVAPSDASVFITGESGTGKEVMARFIHSKSKRAQEKFVAVNCAAIPDNLLESELFGHEKGSFTGAVTRRVGKFEEANNGTLLLDEISEMDLRLQSKLLRALQEREIDRVGGTQPVKINIRVLATSNRDLVEHVKAGNFREDLYYRLNVVNVAIPPLRERPKDIEVLATHFIQKYAEANDVKTKALSAAARKKIMGHHWRGNVRELENTMHRAVLLAQENEIEEEAIFLTDGIISQSTNNGSEDASLVGKTVAEVERDLIIDTLQHCLGNRTHAANILGISIRTLRNKLKQYHDEGVSVPPSGDMEDAAMP